MMHTTHLKKIDGSVMLAVPPAILDKVQLRSGSAVNITVDRGRLIIAPEPCKQYSLDELLAQCDASAPLPDDNSDWTTSAPQGRELV